MNDRFDVHKSDPHSMAAPEFWFLGVQMSTVKPMDQIEWTGHLLPGTPEPLLVLTIDVGMLGSDDVGRIAPFAINADGAAVLIASIRAGFSIHGAGAALTAALDQIEAQARGLHK